MQILKAGIPQNEKVVFLREANLKSKQYDYLKHFNLKAMGFFFD